MRARIALVHAHAVAVAAVAAVAVAVAVVTVVIAIAGAGCKGRVEIAPPPGLEPPDCTAPDRVDAVDVVPLALGDVVDGSVDPSAAPTTYSFCMVAGDWLRFSFDDRVTLQQPALSISKGSAELAQNRFFVFDDDPATQLYAQTDGVFTLTPSPVNPDLPGGFSMRLARPDADETIIDGGSIDFGQQAYGILEDDGADIITLPHVDEAAVLEVQAAVAGFFGNGATLYPIVDALAGADDGNPVSAAVVFARLDFSTGHVLRVPVDAGDYALRIHADGAVGERPFYALERIVLTAAPVRESDDGGNNIVDGAEPLQLHETEPGVLSATVAVDLTRNDVDMFSFLVVGGKTASFACAGESAGSGVRGLVAELRDVSGATISRTEGPVDHTFVGGTKTFLDAADASFTNATGGTYVGSVHADDFALDVAGTWALCTASSR